MFGEVFGSAISAFANAQLAKKQFEYSQQLAEQQNQYNLDMWRLQADYNSPASQMQRFREAGLNPNLIYGQGSSGNMSQAPQQITATPPDYAHTMSDISRAASYLGIAERVENLIGMHRENEKRQKEIEAKDFENSSKDALQQLNWAKLLGYVNYASEHGLRTGNGNAPDAGGYFSRLYAHQLERLLKNNMLTSQRTSLAKTQEALNDLQSNFYRTRNAWQPWQYGVQMGTDILGSILPWSKFFRSGNQAVKNFNFRVNGL